jgi:hypothetical protein
MIRLRLVLAFSLMLAGMVAGPASAVVLGGGTADKDCRVAFGGVDATAGASGVVCADGDPACDTDGSADGACTFQLSVCVGVPVAGCQSAALDAIETAGIALSVPALPAADGTCGESTATVVPIGSTGAATLLARGGRELREVDYLNACCVAEGDAFAAAACAVAADVSASGCSAIPDKAIRGFARAAERVDAARLEPSKARRLLRKAARLANKTRKVGRKLGRRNDCGHALGLMGTHARDTLRAAAP